MLCISSIIIIIIIIITKCPVGCDVRDWIFAPSSLHTMPVNKIIQGGFKMCLSNVRSLVNKLDDFKFSVLNDN